MIPSLKTITVYTLRIAKSAVAQALIDLCAGAHFYIASIKDKALPRLLPKSEASSATHQDASTRRVYF